LQKIEVISFPIKTDAEKIKKQARDGKSNTKINETFFHTIGGIFDLNISKLLKEVLIPCIAANAIHKSKTSRRVCNIGIFEIWYWDKTKRAAHISVGIKQKGGESPSLLLSFSFPLPAKIERGKYLIKRSAFRTP
jgi:hypothetical protein